MEMNGREMKCYTEMEERLNATSEVGNTGQQKKKRYEKLTCVKESKRSLTTKTGHDIKTRMDREK